MRAAHILLDSPASRRSSGVRESGTGYVARRKVDMIKVDFDQLRRELADA